MALVQVALKTTPFRQTVQRLPSKRGRQAGKLLISQELNTLEANFGRIPTREPAPFQLYNM